MKRTQLHLAIDQIERLKAIAERKGVSMAEIIRRAIEAYLAAEERRERWK
jgi:predicted DNA-binding protein